jgi:hypothetical protein
MSVGDVLPGPGTICRIVVVALLGLGLMTSSGCARTVQTTHQHAEPTAQTEQAESHHEGDAAEADTHHQGEAANAMAGHHAHLGGHMKWTARRLPTVGDIQRAQQIVQTLRAALQKYRDYRVAIADGFEPFLPHVAQPRYHFTRKWNGFKAAFGFDPAAPTSLLYKKTGDGYELIGAMYTAPKRFGEERLHERVPLSVGQWHAHVNICLPPRGTRRDQADWNRFGLTGAIVTKEQCDRADGRFFPQIFGWMLHVYPYEDGPAKIWTH